MTPERHALVVRISQAFARDLRACLPAATMDLIVASNSTEPDRNVCHSHDYLDANMVMAGAWEEVMGREPNVDSDEDCELWNLAWDRAKDGGFSTE